MFFIFRDRNQEILDRLEAIEDNMFYLYNKTKHNINEKEEIMSKKLEKLTKEVAEQVEVINSAMILIAGLTAALEEAGTDADALAELADTLDASQAELAAAVAANTPAAPVVEVEEPAPDASTGEFVG